MNDSTMRRRIIADKRLLVGIRKATMITAVVVPILWLFGCENPVSTSDPNPTPNPTTYSVAYEGNGNSAGTAPIDNGAYEQGDVVTVLGSSDLSKSSHEFTGWSTDSAADVPEHVPGDTFSIGSQAVTLYAVWDQTSDFTVTYYRNDATTGTEPDDPTLYETGDTITVLGPSSLARDGYSFLGWNTNSDGSGLSYAEGDVLSMGDENVQLYAQWDITTTSHTVEGVSFEMRLARAATFPAGLNDDSTSSVAASFWIAETEVTYELWYEVKTWAEANGYVFANPGREGSSGIDGNSPTIARNEPVTFVSWHDAIVWLNALSEAKSVQPVYTYGGNVIKDATNTTACDAANQEATGGFRLPTSAEWELAARYRGTDSSGAAIEYPSGSGDYWAPGDFASGAIADVDDAQATQAVAWYDANSGDTTHEVAMKARNALGLYDVSGNVSEWVFDWNSDYVGTWRKMRGGRYQLGTTVLRVGSTDENAKPGYANQNMGFRFVQTQ